MKLTDDWYTNESGRRSLKTIDQARMDEQGRIFVIGHYKDIVIRGGKNLACTMMEANLAKNPKLIPFNVQIIPAPDSIAGEVPIAATDISVSPASASEIQETLRQNVGREYVPDEELCAEELGLSGFPRTVEISKAGSIQKGAQGQTYKITGADDDTHTLRPAEAMRTRQSGQD